MKNFKYLILIVVLFCGLTVNAQNTTVWIVRHAEKDTTYGSDPVLSTIGKLRAEQLSKELKGQNISAIYSTNYKRTRQTAEPTQKQFNINAIQTYSPADLAKVAKQILADYPGKSILIVGHSNTLIPTVAAFGADKPLETLTDDDYDFLFKVTIDKSGKATVQTKHYGAMHHITNVPAN